MCWRLHTCVAAICALRVLPNLNYGVCSGGVLYNPPGGWWDPGHPPGLVKGHLPPSGLVGYCDISTPTVIPNTCPEDRLKGGAGYVNVHI